VPVVWCSKPAASAANDESRTIMRHHLATSGLLAGTLLTAGLVATFSPPASASSPPPGQGATRLFAEEHFDGTEHVSADNNPCGPWAATLHEIRNGGYHVLLPPGGQTTGEAHVNGAVDGWIQLTPDDPTLPTYTGTYREKADGVLTDPEDDQFREFRFQLRDRLTGSDGSTLVLVLGAKVTVDANGRTVVDRSIATCG
jgi:hypothetical protein